MVLESVRTLSDDEQTGAKSGDGDGGTASAPNVSKQPAIEVEPSATPKKKKPLEKKAGKSQPPKEASPKKTAKVSSPMKRPAAGMKRPAAAPPASTAEEPAGVEPRQAMKRPAGRGLAGPSGIYAGKSLCKKDGVWSIKIKGKEVFRARSGCRCRLKRFHTI